jgi:hypothetical protein
LKNEVTGLVYTFSMPGVSLVKKGSMLRSGVGL